MPKDPESPRFYSVDRFAQIISDTSVRKHLTFPARTLRRILAAYDSVQGLAISLGSGLFFFTVSVVLLISAMHGALTFLATVSALLGIVGLFVHRKVGKHLSIVDLSLRMNILATAGGFLLAVGLILGMIFIARIF